MGPALYVLLWWLALFGWWIVVVGTNSGLKLVAGACVALVVALLAAALRHRFKARLPAKALNLPWKVVRAIGAVFGALALHLLGQRRLSSRYRAFDSLSGDPDSEQPTTRPSGLRPRG
jgi:multisubunit Na+/H+ antiporter MnhB subunit